MTTEELVISMYQNTSTAIQSISDLIKKADDKVFQSLLEAQAKRYKEIKAKIKKLSDKEHIDLKDNSWFEKAKLWTSIQMGTIADNSTRHLAELMLVGTVMGTLTCYKNHNDYNGKNQNAKLLLKELEHMEEDNFKELKKYLKE